MSRLTKIMLGIMIINSAASALFLTGLVDVNSAPGFYVVFPLAAIFFGLFLISRVFGNETAAFDAERHAHRADAARHNHSQTVESVHGDAHPAPTSA